MRVPPGPPMTLANMRQNGVRSVTASCANCGRLHRAPPRPLVRLKRAADVNVDLLPDIAQRHPR